MILVSWEEDEKQIDVAIDDISDGTKVEVNHDQEHLEEEPKYGMFRKISQKKEQAYLNYPSMVSWGVILVTLVKLFVQIFDMLTDTIISNSFFVWSVHLHLFHWAKSFWIENKPAEFCISFALILAPCVAKWRTFTDYINNKCKRGIFSSRTQIQIRHTEWFQFKKIINE